MWFLLVQIFILLLLAAVLGGLIVYWWVKNRYEDVTESHSSLVEQLGLLRSNDDAITPDFLRDEMQRQLQEIKDQQLLDTEQAMSRLKSVETAISQIHIPDPDLSPVNANLTDLKNSMAKVTNTNLAPVEKRMDDIYSKVGFLSTAIEKNAPSLTPLETRLARLESSVHAIRIPEVDLTSIYDQLEQLRVKVTALNTSLRNGAIDDKKAISAALQSIYSSVTALKIPDIEPVRSKISNVERLVGDISIPETDLTPVLDSLVEIESTIDFSSLENRLTSLEYGLAAVHDMLRSHGFGSSKRSGSIATTKSEYKSRDGAKRQTSSSFANYTKSMIASKENENSAAVRASLLSDSMYGKPDDLTLVDGIGPLMQEQLNAVGVYYCWQIASWTTSDATWMDSQLNQFPGRIARDKWVRKAIDLVKAGKASKRPPARPV